MHSQNDKRKHEHKHKSQRAKGEKAPRRRAAPRRARDTAALAEHDLAEAALPVGALLEIADWVLDLARGAAYDDAGDLQIVERVRAYIHARAHGLPARAPAESELLTAVALAVAAMEQRHGVVGLGELVAQSLDADVRVVPRAVSPCRIARRAPRLSPHLYCVP